MIHIAFADDHALIRTSIIDIIHKHPQLKVVADAEHGQELINKIAMLNCKPDICILDISMPVYDGFRTIKDLKRTYPDMKFLVLSAHDAEFSIIRMIKSGANGYLTKNCKIQELYDALITIHEDDYFYSPLATEKAFRTINNNKVTELTEREEQFLQLCCSELDYKSIARIMNSSVRTVESYQQTIGQKLHLHNRLSLALFAIQTGIVPGNWKLESKT